MTTLNFLGCALCQCANAQKVPRGLTSRVHLAKLRRCSMQNHTSFVVRAKWILRPYLVLIFPFLVTVRLVAQDCGQILAQGIYDRSVDITSEQRTVAFINWLKQKQFSSVEEAEKSGFQLGVIIEGYPVGVGATSESQRFAKFMSDIDNYQSLSDDIKVYLKQTIETVDTSLVSAWRACVTQDGFHFWWEQSFDPHIFILHARYRNPGSNPGPRLLSFQFNPPDTVDLKTGPFFKKGSLFGGSKIKLNTMRFSGAEVEQSFLRVNDKALTVTITATEGNAFTIKLPAIPSSNSPPSGPCVLDLNFQPSFNLDVRNENLVNPTVEATVDKLERGSETFTNAVGFQVFVHRGTYLDSANLAHTEGPIHQQIVIQPSTEAIQLKITYTAIDSGGASLSQPYQFALWRLPQRPGTTTAFDIAWPGGEGNLEETHSVTATIGNKFFHPGHKNERGDEDPNWCGWNMSVKLRIITP